MEQMILEIVKEGGTLAALLIFWYFWRRDNQNHIEEKKKENDSQLKEVEDINKALQNLLERNMDLGERSVEAMTSLKQAVEAMSNFQELALKLERMDKS